MIRNVCILLLALFISPPAADKQFSVTEGFGVSRTNAPVSGGIALIKGELFDSTGLSLFSDGREIPGQFIPLTRFKDNSLQWVLVDFTDDFASGQKKDYAVRLQPAAASPDNPITVTRAGSVITLDNGLMQLSVDTLDFRGIHSLIYKGRSMIDGNGGLSLLDVRHGSVCVNGPVTRAGFVYLGKVRASLRIEGVFFMDSTGGTGYSYLLTVYAGSPRIRVSATLRNSINPVIGRAARISYARANFALAYDPSSVIAYDTVLVRAYTQTRPDDRDTLRTARAYDHPSGGGLTVTEKWGGGNYPPNINRTNLAGRSLEVDIIRQYHAQATYPLFYVDSIYVMRDLTHKASEIILECYDGAFHESGLRNMHRRMKGRLIPFQDPQALAEANALSAGRFGTVADETAAYAKWGWTVPADVRTQEVPAAQTDVCPRFTLDIHGDSETDPVRNFLLQWVRTGKQGIFDVGECWARYYRDLVTWRTDGFVHDGQYQVGSWFRNNCKRLPKGAPVGDDAVWTYYVADYNTYGGCHTAMEGMADYYCLTGDPEALEALEDYGEMELIRTKVFMPDTTSASKASFSDRATGRKFSFLIRLYEITKAPVWWDLVKLKATAMIRSNLRDPLVYAKEPVVSSEAQHNEFLTRTLPMPDSLSNYLKTNRIGFERGTGNPLPYQHVYGMDSVTGEKWPVYETARWEGAYIAQAFSRYFDITGDENARDMLIGYAQYIKWTQTARCRMAGSYAIYLDVPRPGKSVNKNWAYDWDPAHAICYNSYSTTAGGVMEGHSKVKTVLYPSIYALAYSYSGYSYLLEEAKAAWNKGSKYVNTRFIRDETTLHSYAFCGGFLGTLQYPNYDFNEYKDDYVFQVCHAFREAVHHTDTIPPERVTDLFVRRSAGNTGLVFEWSAPAGAAEYQLKYFKGKRIQEYPVFEYNYDKFYASGDTHRVSWWYAVNVEGEPLPAPAGTPQSFSVTGDFPTADTFYAVICSRDTMGNLSFLSNTVEINASTIAAEKGVAPSGAFALLGSPNPFNPSIRFFLTLPGEFKAPAMIRVFDPTGRLVRELKRPSGKSNTPFVWDGKDEKGRYAGSGTYLVRASCGPMAVSRTVTMMK